MTFQPSGANAEMLYMLIPLCQVMRKIIQATEDAKDANLSGSYFCTCTLCD